jgi:hypothetical protein
MSPLWITDIQWIIYNLKIGKYLKVFKSLPEKQKKSLNGIFLWLNRQKTGMNNIQNFQSVLKVFFYVELLKIT